MQGVIEIIMFVK